jgi:hypothetical protein
VIFLSQQIPRWGCRVRRSGLRFDLFAARCGVQSPAVPAPRTRYRHLERCTNARTASVLSYSRRSSARTAEDFAATLFVAVLAFGLTPRDPCSPQPGCCLLFPGLICCRELGLEPGTHRPVLRFLCCLGCAARFDRIEA